MIRLRYSFPGSRPCADRTGKSLWDFQAGVGIGANPISFNADGRQKIAICADEVLYVLGL